MNVNFHLDNGNVITLILDDTDYKNFTEWLDGYRGAWFEYERNGVKKYIRKDKVCMVEVLSK